MNLCVCLTFKSFVDSKLSKINIPFKEKLFFHEIIKTFPQDSIKYPKQTRKACMKNIEIPG